MQLLLIDITQISSYRDYVLLCEIVGKGVVPFKWYPEDEAWLNIDSDGNRFNIDPVWDKDSKEILQVSAVLPSQGLD